MNLNNHPLTPTYIDRLCPNALSHIASFLGLIPEWLAARLDPACVSVRRRVLLYGQVQSGKSARIISLCRLSPIPTIVILQNSLMQLQQCCSRFMAEKLPFQVINSDTEYLLAATIPSTITVVINNTFRLSQLDSLWFGGEPSLSRYAVIVDEADASAKRLCKHRIITQSESETHVTATPFLQFYRSYFHTVEVLNAPKTYMGLAQIQRVFSTDPDTGLAGHTNTINDFMVDDPDSSKMMLVVTRTVRQEEIINTARHLSQKMPHIPCISLATERILFENGRISKRFSPKLTLPNIIDQFGHISLVIVAHNLATRGLSFVSSDYSRALTHQIILGNANATSLLQRCRIFGTCPRDTAPILALPTPKSLDRADHRVLEFDPATFLTNASPYHYIEPK
jgi:hypothetical protein